MARKLVISDIHGHGQQLLSLLDKAKYYPSSDQLILLGDYIHKGPDSKKTVKIVRQLYENGAIALRGNHEQREIDQYMSKSMCAFSKKDIHFFHQLRLYYEDEEYIYVHAGIRPNIPLNRQKPEDILSIRNVFASQRLHTNKKVIFGHTPTFRLGSAHDIWICSDKIGIDTGAAHGGKLSLVDLTNKLVYSHSLSPLSTIDVKNFSLEV
ncbi:metallophosphoesterase family protein [Gracilibacillus sp. S3-1-1]|uniref:Metallophosphoesterase family protein n=1 Tax=Gracilibacillus pellucidus TaxID=3095368 RepID=A0ACC6M6M8_9BACI|nr:metallophosphoesterase family protein [Gracilibacillus sp. S3-1-1]MDX8046502.1 metallophosphoesterase family protein [Gracilibacillus sp. S3-1-1]